MVKILEEIKKLSIEEQIRLVTEVWNNIPEETEESKPSPQMKQLLDKRWNEHLENPESGASVDEVIARIKSRW